MIILSYKEWNQETEKAFHTGHVIVTLKRLDSQEWLLTCDVPGDTYYLEDNETEVHNWFITSRVVCNSEAKGIYENWLNRREDI